VAAAALADLGVVAALADPGAAAAGGKQPTFFIFFTTELFQAVYDALM
jgi:hypothetical protein